MTPIGASTRAELIEMPRAQAALSALLAPVAPQPFVPLCMVVQPDEIPHPQDALLVHHEHMTVVLQKFHGRPVTVEVMEEHFAGDYYTRKICLRPEGSQTVVEWGVVRLDLRFIPPAARDEILAKKLPLGAVLIKHNVLRRIKPRWFLQFPPDGPVLRMFGAQENHPLYGRVGTIYCNGKPAIELLEIVAGLNSK